MMIHCLQTLFQVCLLTQPVHLSRNGKMTCSLTDKGYKCVSLGDLWAATSLLQLGVVSDVQDANVSANSAGTMIEATTYKYNESTKVQTLGAIKHCCTCARL